MIRLQALGGAFLTDGAGMPASRTASQGRTIALVALLATAGRTGLSREKVVGILWPNSSPRRARHSLTQALYAARRALDCDDLFLVSGSVCLNPERITSDVGEFEDAVAAGMDERAVALYGGPFLDGFFSQATEFEQWQSAMRARFEDAVVSALERLIAASEAACDRDATFKWLRQLANIRPYSTSVAIRYIEAAVTAGDRTAALEFTARHAQIVRDEYDLEPEPAFLELAATLRTPVADTAGAMEDEVNAREAGPVKTSADLSFDASPAYPVQVYEVPSARRIESYRRQRVSTSARVIAAILAVFIIVPVLYWADRKREPVFLDQRVVVAPFRVHAADASISFLREGLVELLSTRLADDPDARGVDAGAVLRAWRRAGVTQDSSASRETVVKLATQFGAERVIVGSVLGSAEHATVNASVIEVRTGAIGADATVSGPIDSVTALVDRLAARLLASQAGLDEQLANSTSTSLPALRSYIRGLQEYARGNHAVARDHYEDALQVDSTFSLAALRLAFAAARLHDYDLERRALHQAWTHRGGLSARDQMHLQALTGPIYPDAGRDAETNRSWEAALRFAPDRAEAWFGFAHAIAANGSAAQSSDERERAIAGLEHALTLDPNYSAALLLLARLQGAAGSEMLAEWERLSRTSADSIHPSAPLVSWRAIAGIPDRPERAISNASLRALGPSNLRALVAASQFDAVALEDAEHAVTIALSRTGNFRQAIDLLLAQHSLATNRGRPQEALEITRRIQRMNPASRAHLRLRVLDVLYADGDSAAAEDAARELTRGLVAGSMEHRAADACVLAQWRLARSDTAAARALVDALPSSAAEPLSVSMPAPICRVLVEAWLAVEGNTPDAKARLASLDSVVLTSASAGDAAVYGHILLSRLHVRMNDSAAALAAISRRPYMSAAWPRYLATALREEGALAEAVGDQHRASSAMAAYLALRKKPEA